MMPKGKRIIVKRLAHCPFGHFFAALGVYLQAKDGFLQEKGVTLCANNKTK